MNVHGPPGMDGRIVAGKSQRVASEGWGWQEYQIIINDSTVSMFEEVLARRRPAVSAIRTLCLIRMNSRHPLTPDNMEGHITYVL